MSDEIRPLSFGEILDSGFRVLRDHFVLVVGIAAIFYVPFGLLMNALLPADGGAPSPEELGMVLLGVVFAMAVVNPIVLAAITHAVGETYLGRETSIGESLRFGLSILLPLLGTSILAVLLQLVGFVLLIVPGIYLALAFLLLQQVMVLERTFGFDALGRSHILMQGQKLRGVGIVIVGSLITTVLGVGVGLMAAMIPMVGPVLEAFAQAIGYAFMSAVLVIFYFDIRCRREAFDLEHLAQLVESDDLPPRPAPIG